jgi:peptidoglycan/xylan/chitin deacetylase (PgdA/CDA1 family)
MRVIKFIIAVLLYYSGLLDLLLYLDEKRGRKPLILLNHRVLDIDDPEMLYSIPGMTITPAVLEAQLNFLKKRFKILSTGSLQELLEKGMPLPHRSVLITFDDGWRDNYVNALPILKAAGVPAIIFITAGLVETADMVWFNKAIMIFKSGKIEPEKIMSIVRSICRDPAPPAELPEDIVGFVDMLKPYNIKVINEVLDRLFKESCLEKNNNSDYRNILSWDEIAEMKSAGIEFGSHGMSHGILPLLGREDIKWELAQSKKIMESKIGSAIDTFAYPNGDYNSEIIDITGEAGYKCAFGTEIGAKDAYKNRFTLPRLGIHTGACVGPRGNFSKAIFMLKISGFQKFFKGK